MKSKFARNIFILIGNVILVLLMSPFVIIGLIKSIVGGFFIWLFNKDKLIDSIFNEIKEELYYIL